MITGDIPNELSCRDCENLPGSRRSRQMPRSPTEGDSLMLLRLPSKILVLRIATRPGWLNRPMAWWHRISWRLEVTQDPPRWIKLKKWVSGKCTIKFKEPSTSTSLQTERNGHSNKWICRCDLVLSQASLNWRDTGDGTRTHHLKWEEIYGSRSMGQDLYLAGRMPGDQVPNAWVW